MFRTSSPETAKPEHISFQFPNCDHLRLRFHAPANRPVSLSAAPASPGGHPHGAHELTALRVTPDFRQGVPPQLPRGPLEKGPCSAPASQSLPWDPPHSMPETSYIYHEFPRGLEVQKDLHRPLTHLPPTFCPPTFTGPAVAHLPSPETCQAPPDTLWSLSPRDTASPQSEASSRNQCVPWIAPFHTPPLPGSTTPTHPVVQKCAGKTIS